MNRGGVQVEEEGQASIPDYFTHPGRMVQMYASSSIKITFKWVDGRTTQHENH